MPDHVILTPRHQPRYTIYLGDGVSASLCEHLRSVVLTTSDGGNSPTNTIYLDEDVMENLLVYRKRMMDMISKTRKTTHNGT